MSGVPPESAIGPGIRVAKTRLVEPRQRDTKRFRSRNFNWARSTGSSSRAEEYFEWRKPHCTELDNPRVRCAFRTQVTGIPVASMRYRTLAGGTTTTMAAAFMDAASSTVLRSKLTP